jgi:hypothetical protein
MVSPLKPTDSLKDAYPKLNETITQSNDAKVKADDALAKANNPLATLSSAGYKIMLSDLSTEVQNSMTGTTGITTAKGYIENNRGVDYPLRNLTKDGQVYAVSQTVKDVVLDAKVLNASPGKIYAITYISKGNNSSYGFTVDEFDESTFSTSSASSRRRVVYYVDFPFSAPLDNITTRVIEKEGKVFIVTIDYSKITTSALNISETVAGVAQGAVIDKGNYVIKPDYPVGLGQFENNRGVDFPLRAIVKDGVKSPVSQTVKEVILDVKVINAIQGKYYSIAYVANGFNGSYGITIDQYDKSTFATNSASSKSQVTYYLNTPFSAPTENPVTRILNAGDLIFVITLDYSKIPLDNLNINSTASGQALSAVIDESCYIFQKQQTIETGTDKYSFPMVALKTGTTLAAKFVYSDSQNMIIEFDLLGINQITHLKRIYTQDKVAGTMDNDLYANRVLLYEASSDWISPYRIEALSNGNGNSLFTTGANHGTNNGEGFPTARNGGAKIYVDDMELRDGEVSFAREKVVIETVQYVSAFNAVNLTTGDKRDSLKETIKYTITPGNLAVSLNFEALEDLNVKNYAGLQMQKGVWGNKIYFMEDAALPTVYDISGANSAQSSTKANGQPDRWVAKGSSHTVVAYYDEEIGLGDRVYVDTTETMLYTTGTKIYGKLLYNAAGRTLLAGDSMYWCGGYTFTQGLSCPGAETAYKIRNSGGQKVYVVDFITAANTFLQVDASDYNKKITVIEKSSSITVDNYITAKGLKIAASGYGQLKFTVG